MKKLLIAAVIVFAQVTIYAQGRPRPAYTRLTEAQQRKALEITEQYKKISEFKSKDRKAVQDPAMNEKVVRMLSTEIASVKDMSATEKEGLLSLMRVAPLETIAEVMSLSTLPNKAVASKSLTLLTLAGKNLNLLVADKTAQVESVKEIMQATEKVSSLTFVEATEFVSAFEKALLEGKSVRQAVEIAAKGKFTFEELMECV